ncbi:uncharacterized protein LOC135952646 [Calliphora vicina]|uniref:uncharacterized protein LOC135952646 n=1 Tax=Calliphora vicina TaxID=7373 RepID=UPI00325A7793
MATTSSTNTPTTESIATVSNPAVSTIITTASSMTNPVLSTQASHDLSISSEADQTVISPTFLSETAQNIRREVREVNQRAEQALQVRDVQNIVSASVGLQQIQLMKEVDDKIQKALNDVKQLILSLSAQNQTQTPTSRVNDDLPPLDASRTSREANTSRYVQPEVSHVQQSYAQQPPLIPAPNCVPIGQHAPQVVEACTRQTPAVTQYQQQQSLLQQQNPLPCYQLPAQPYVQPPQLPPSQAQAPYQGIPQYQGYQRYENTQPGYPQDAWSGSAAQPPPQQPQSYNFAMSMPRRQEPLDKFKLAKWGVKFDGTNKTINVQEFIFRVGALRRDYSCTDNELLRSFHILLEGPALDWYWDYRKIVHINTWEELEKALLAQYRRFEQEHEIQMRILNRRQLPQETFDEFYNAVIKLRNQQQNPYVEEQIVEIMRGNLKPSLAQMMFSVRLKTLSEFCREVRRAENLLANQRQMYQRSAQRVNELYCVEDEQSLIDLEVDGIRSTSHYTCWNCKVVGHSFMDCPEPITRTFCFRCGRENVVAPKCPKCQGNRPRNPSRTGEARSTDV